MLIISPHKDPPPIYDRATLMDRYETKLTRFGISQGDCMSFSSAGKRLNLVVNGIGKALAQPMENQWKPVTDSSMDKYLKLIDKHIIKSGELLDQMKVLATAARDDSLDDTDRLVMQMQIGYLQHELNIAFETMGASLVPGNIDRPSIVEGSIRNSYGRFENSLSGKMLSRALERVSSGEKWDVSEALNTIVVDCWMGSHHPIGYEWEVVDWGDDTVPTVGEILKGKGRSLMDVEAANVSAAELDKDIEKLKKQRSKLADFVAKTGGEADEAEYLESSKNYGFAVRVFEFMRSLYRESAQFTWGIRKRPDGTIAGPVQEDRFPLF